jgi:hypothetical protein
LANAYNDVRKTQQSGNPRTAAMTKLVSQMIEAARRFEPLSDEAVRGLVLDRVNTGKRLAGYAHLYVHPRPELVSELVESITTIEHKPFGQYWGLQAVGRVLAEPGPQQERLSRADLRRRLEQFRARLEKGTDRWYEATRILEHLEPDENEIG